MGVWPHDLLHPDAAVRTFSETTTPSIELAIVGGPLQQILRPAELESEDFSRYLQQTGLFGHSPVLDSSLGTTVEVRGDSLYLLQGSPRVCVTQTGSVMVSLPIGDPTSRPTSWLAAVIEEDVADRIATAISFSVEVLDRIDPTHRLSRVVPQCRLANSGYTTWRSRAEHESNPQSAVMNLGPQSSDSVVGLSPPSLSRQALRHEASALTEDLVTLLRRKVGQ